MGTQKNYRIPWDVLTKITLLCYTEQMYLPQDFYNQSSPDVAKALLGKKLVYAHPKGRISGIINETEAYTEEDPACHAFGGKKTKRNAPMFLGPGHIYMYLIYGMYTCLNIVTEAEDRGCAVLIRSLIPDDGLALMQQHRGPKINVSHLCDGPGKLVIALDLPRRLNGKKVYDSTSLLRIYDNNYTPKEIKETPRIGIRKGQDLQWRFKLSLP